MADARYLIDIILNAKDNTSEAFGKLLQNQKELQRLQNEQQQQNERVGQSFENMTYFTGYDGHNRMTSSGNVSDHFYHRALDMISLRSSSAVLLSRMPTSISGAVATAALTFPGGGTGIPFPGSGGLVFGVTLGTAKNLGYSRTHANVLLTGPLTNPAVINLTNGRRVVISGSLLTGESLTIDSRLRTVVDGLGNNRYDLTGPENDWLLLEKGDNVIATGADAIGGNATVSWRHAGR